MIHNLTNEHREQFFNEGYLAFSLNKDFQNKLKSFRNRLNYKKLLFSKYDRNVEAELLINGMKAQGSLHDLYELSNSIQDSDFKCSQMWMTIFDDKKWNDEVYFQEEIQQLIDFFYGEGFARNTGMGESCYLLYTKGCRFSFHKDGGYVKVGGVDESITVSTILFYLNENWKDGYGGEIVVKKNDGEIITIEPDIGTCVMLELTKNDLEHKVNEVCEDDYLRDNLRLTLVKK